MTERTCTLCGKPITGESPCGNAHTHCVEATKGEPLRKVADNEPLRRGGGQGEPLHKPLENDLEK